MEKVKLINCKTINDLYALRGMPLRVLCIDAEGEPTLKESKTYQVLTHVKYRGKDMYGLKNQPIILYESKRFIAVE